MNYEKLINRKIKGFKFESTPDICYIPKFDFFIGKIGKIYYSDENYVGVCFEDYSTCFFYPTKDIEKHLLPIEEQLYEIDIPMLGKGV